MDIITDMPSGYQFWEPTAVAAVQSNEWTAGRYCQCSNSLTMLSNLFGGKQY
jgi:hypothetical protein